EWIFGQVFEISAVHGRTSDVDAGAKQEVDATRAGVFSQTLTQFAGKVAVPGCRQGNSTRIGSGWSPGAHANGCVGHFEAGQIDRRNRIGKHSVDAADQLDFLFKG